MKISCNVKQGTSLVKNSSQTVEIKDKTNEKKPYLEQNISNHKLDGSDKKANTNTSPEMKISCNVKQGTSLVKNSSQTVELKDKTNEKEPYLEQNISNHKLDGSDKKANTNTSPEITVLRYSITYYQKDLFICAQYANKHKAIALHKAYWLPCLVMRMWTGISSMSGWKRGVERLLRSHLMAFASYMPCNIAFLSSTMKSIL